MERLRRFSASEPARTLAEPLAGAIKRINLPEPTPLVTQEVQRSHAFDCVTPS